MAWEIPEYSDHSEFMIAQYREEMPELGDLTAMETLSRLHREAAAPTIKTFGLQLGAFDVLAALWRSGGDFVLTPAQLLEMTMVTSGGMTARLDRLEKAGWIRRDANPYDKRSFIVILSQAGKELIERVLVGHLINEEKVVRPLPHAEQAPHDAPLSILLARFAEPGQT